MRFGPVPVAQAEGHILAHSMTAGTARIRKGTVLGPDEIAMLTQAGHVQVTVACLDAGDVHEDAAATRLAAALVPDGATQGLRLSRAATGRVNIHAEVAGVVLIDAGAVHALNRVNPMITLATVPPFYRMDAGGMVATAKIISYAVPQADVARACTLAQAALSVARPIFADATLIETKVTPEVPSPKGRQALAARLQRLGMTLTPRVIVGHEISEIAAAIRAAPGQMVFVLTGSATSDSHDVAPQAVRQAGGEVIHYGMPVDPGNLLFIGTFDRRPVIGLPGCARSPALNGADWVMERVICGLTVGADDIAAMGLGGLLKEIPTRPSPREG